MMVVADVDDVFVPVPVDEILIHPYHEDSRQCLLDLLDQLLALHSHNQAPASTFGAAVHVAVEAMV